MNSFTPLQFPDGGTGLIVATRRDSSTWLLIRVVIPRSRVETEDHRLDPQETQQTVSAPTLISFLTSPSIKQNLRLTLDGKTHSFYNFKSLRENLFLK